MRHLVRSGFPRLPAGVRTQAAPAGLNHRSIPHPPSFFDQLDEQLRAERSADVEPSAADFVVKELPAVIERFATDFESLPEVIDGVLGGGC